MRNGLNVSNVSEFVHEIREVPEEARVRYRTEVSMLRANLASARVRTCAAGTIRVARAFELPVALGAPVPGGSAPSAAEYFQAALGGCVLVTYVYGSSSKGVTLSQLGIAVETTEDAQRRPRLRYSLDVDADADDRQVGNIARYVSLLSPNHRTLLETNRIDARIELSDARGRSRSELVLESTRADQSDDAQSDVVASHRCDLRWRYGTQLDGHVCSASDGRVGFPITIDQPKQYLGIDEAPNPQELLFAALGADVLSGLLALADSRKAATKRATVDFSGALDVRGVLNVERTAPVKVHAIRAALGLEADGDQAELHELAARALRESSLCRLVCDPQSIEVTVRSRESELFKLSSNQRLLRAQLAIGA
ncbi:MAG TPA: OsmC family protein [Polyangiaceae bacterium]|nr:OsmC family protein [Polyangiaceae bacterium]